MPWQLIPYKKWTIALVLSIALYGFEHSIMDTLDKFEIPAISFDDSGQKMLLTSPKQLSELREIVQSSCQKLKICLLIRFGMSYAEFINYCMKYISDFDENIRGPTGLFLDYYNKNGGYYRNSQFLYGRASQFR